MRRRGCSTSDVGIPAGRSVSSPSAPQLPLPLSLLLLLLLPLAAHWPGCTATPDVGREEQLIGWRGETWDSEAGSQLNAEAQAAQGGDSGAADVAPPENRTQWVETISWQPRAFLFHNFLTLAECDHLVGIGTKRVERSLVIDAKTGSSTLDEIRTSYGAAFGRGEDDVIAGIEEKIAEWSHLPAENGEPMQILRYVDGQKYGAHWDWFDDVNHPKGELRGGDNRYATVLMYLADGVTGGETALPLAVGIDEDLQRARVADPSECARKGSGIAVVPHKGDALLFFDMDVEGKVGDRSALHASCPTSSGVKWTATKWIHNHPYGGTYNALQKAMRCADDATDCKQLLKHGPGACDADGMTGAGGRCRKSCGDCIECASSDLICGRANMKGRYRPQAS